MKFFFTIFLINIFMSIIEAGLTVSRLVVRVPRAKDIGLIFDVSITNDIKDNRRELLEFNIRPTNECSLDLGAQRVMNDAGRLIGGNFGNIDAGATETVSLIWPTISLYNRVGCCSIIISSSNLKNEQFFLKQTLAFDTRFDAIDPQGTGIRKSKKYKDCNNFDLDYLNDCKPVNCEERYFGLRNYFSERKQQCEPVPRCEGGMHYDPFFNECVDSHYTISQSDINNIKRGYFNEYGEWIKEISRNSYNMPYAYKKFNKRENNDESNDNDDSVHSTQDLDPSTQNLRSAWLKGTMDGLTLVFATIGIYVIICFVLFLVVSSSSRRQGYRDSVSFSTPPSVSEKGIPLRSRSSLLSRR